MTTFFRATIKIVALRQIKARARTWISGHVFPIVAFSEHWTYRQSPALFLWKGAFCRKIGVHISQQQKNSSPNNLNYFIILPNNSNRVSLKLKSSEAKFVWSNLKRVETCYVTSARTKTFFASIEFQNNREEKSLRHVAMVANFLNDNKLKTSLKKWIRSVSNFIDLIQFHLICQILATFSGQWWIRKDLI